jgi:transposase
VSRERAEQALGKDLGLDERDELVELRRQNAELRMERDLLKRSLAFWVKESTPNAASSVSMTKRLPGSR